MDKLEKTQMLNVNIIANEAQFNKAQVSFYIIYIKEIRILWLLVF